MLNKVLVVGAGFSGAVIARILSENGFLVDVIDKRSHIAGNAFDYLNHHNILVHQYGPHLFHTNNRSVFEFLSRFTDWVDYQHRVKAMLDTGELLTLPVNLDTKNKVGKDKVIDTFIRPYSEKMWGLKLEEISPDIINRVPVRNDTNELYFPDDQFQAMPKGGYTKMFKNLLNHQNIQVKLATEFHKDMEDVYMHVFNSMPIDEYYDYSLGPLPYRSLKFHHVDLPIPRLFPVCQVNFTNTGPYTRVVEWKNIPNSPQNPLFTSLTYEEPCSYTENNNERFYPVKDASGQNRALYMQYKQIENPKTTFIGRLGQYVYLDMHQVISSSMATAEKFAKDNPL
jgi:UDP-galactopyranose mutase